MKKIFSILAMIALIAVVIVACKDNFNENDFLNLQAKLKTQQDTAKLNQQVKALNDAGELLSFTVQVVEDRTPLAGVDVTISNDVSALTTKVTTDANGNAVFTKVRVGSNTLLLSKSGYITSTAVVDFGTLTNPNYFTTVSGANGTTNIIPMKQSRSVLLPLFATGGTGSTAKIQGKVTIETDLTNRTPEIPQGLTIRANYASGIAAAVKGNNGVDIVTYSFSAAGVGVATVDNTTGLYSMTVPATAAGLTMSLLLPTIDANQKVAAINLDGKPIATGPQYRNVPTSFGPQVGFDNSIPSVPGAVVNFTPAPVAPGAGVKFNFTAAPRSLVASFGSWTMEYNDNFGNGQVGDGPTYAFQAGATQYELTNVGAGYTSAPTMTLTGGGATTQATMQATLGGVLKTLTLGVGGTGYVGPTVSVTMRYKDVGGSNINMYSFSAPITVSAGVITGLTLPTIITGINGLDPARPFHTVDFGNGYGIQSFDVVISGGGGTGATATATFANFVDGVKVTAIGDGYTSAPTITFSGGGGTTQAVLQILEWRSKWNIAIDNSSNTSPYKILPNNIYMSAVHTNGQFYTESSVADQFNNSSTLYNELTVSGGQIVWANPTKSYITGNYMLQPTIVIEDFVTTPALAVADVNNDGTIGGITVNQYPVGYDSKVTMSISPTITGAPGSGATIELTNGTLNARTKEFQFDPNDYTIKQPGSGYLQDLNQQNQAPVSGGAYAFSGNTSNFTIKTNDVQVFNFNYGTGKRKENIN